MPQEYTVKEFFEDNSEEFDLEALTENLEGPIQITSQDIHRPAFALTGFMENFLHKRIQIIGETELLYLESLNEEPGLRCCSRVFSQNMPCIIVSKGLDVPKRCSTLAVEHGIPVLRTTMWTTEFIHDLTGHLELIFAPTTMIHGSLVDVYGVGLLFSGRSAIGKSEIALDLVERGHGHRGRCRRGLQARGRHPGARARAPQTLHGDPRHRYHQRDGRFRDQGRKDPEEVEVVRAARGLGPVEGLGPSRAG